MNLQYKSRRLLLWGLMLCILASGLLFWSHGKAPASPESSQKVDKRLPSLTQQQVWSLPLAIAPPSTAVIKTCGSMQLIKERVGKCLTRSLTALEKEKRAVHRLIDQGFKQLTNIDLLGPTQIKVATYNILGAGHTDKGGSRAHWPHYSSRMDYSLDLMKRKNASVIGLQEFQIPQVDYFQTHMPNWGVYPGRELPNPASHNSIVWDEEVWSLQEKHIAQIPYFKGSDFPMPYILLKHRKSGKEVWFANFHNPANVHGPAEKYRNAAVAREADLARNLLETGRPVIFTGDMNDRDKFICPFSQATGMIASTGSGARDGNCTVSAPASIDWIVGSPEIEFSDHVDDFAPRSVKASDHSFISSFASLPPLKGASKCKTLKVGGVKQTFCPSSWVKSVTF